MRMLKAPNFDAFTIKKMGQVMDRARPMLEKREIEYPPTSFLLDLEFAHQQYPMDFDALLAIDDGQFLHDILGIRKYMNRETGELTDCFVPRCVLS